jgi:hypothetical protein
MAVGVGSFCDIDAMPVRVLQVSFFYVLTSCWPCPIVDSSDPVMGWNHTCLRRKHVVPRHLVVAITEDSVYT